MAKYLAYLYSFLVATCSLNAVDNISELYGPVGNMNGREASSDAHSVAEYWGWSYKTWATTWLVFALVCSAVGLLFAFDGRTYKQQQNSEGDIELPGENEIAATAVPVATAMPISQWQRI